MKKDDSVQSLSDLRTNGRVLVCFFGTLLLCVVIAFASYRLHYEYKQEQNNAQREGRNIASAFEMHVRKNLHAAEHQAFSIRTSYEMQTTATQTYSQLPQIMSNFHDLQIADEAGNVVATAVRWQNTPSIAAKDYFRYHRESGGL